jgi:hypothetical protein
MFIVDLAWRCQTVPVSARELAFRADSKDLAKKVAIDLFIGGIL